jgi:hypothetical protein
MLQQVTVITAGPYKVKLKKKADIQDFELNVSYSPVTGLTIQTLRMRRSIYKK